MSIGAKWKRRRETIEHGRGLSTRAPDIVLDQNARGIGGSDVRAHTRGEDLMLYDCKDHTEKTT